MEIKKNTSLLPYNTFRINALAEYFTEASTIDEIQAVLSDRFFLNKPKFILGGGSNVLFTKNIGGLVIKNNLKGISLVREDNDFFYVKAAAGEVWHELVMYCIKNNYAGLENLSLIPGNVGAGPMQNIGAYGVELKDVFFELEAFHMLDKTMITFSNKACQFGYRESVFKRKEKGNYLITSVTFRLNKKPVYNISYGAIEKELEQMGIKNISIQSISNAVCNIRKSKLPDPALIGNAGSFFKNPEVSQNALEAIKNNFENVVFYPLENGNVKLAAGWLIEQCGWKGKTIGNVGVHQNQALVLVNYGNGTGKEIYDLSEQILISVKNKFGVDLEREVNII